MAVIPAETSRPARKWSGSGTVVEEPFWAAVVVLLFLGGLFLLARGALDIARESVSEEIGSATVFVIPVTMAILGLTIVIALLAVFGQHPRTRSATASGTFAAMMAVMLIGGIVLFLGGALRMIRTTEYVEQVTLAMLSLFFLAIPIYLRFKNS